MNPQQQAALRATWMTMLGSVVLFAVLGFALPDLIDLGFAESLAQTLAPAFIVIGVLFGVAGHLVHRRAARSNSPVANHLLPRQAAQAYKPTTNLRVVGWALDQGLADLGLILALFGLPPTDWLVFPIISLVLLLIHRPQVSKPGGPPLWPGA